MPVVSEVHRSFKQQRHHDATTPVLHSWDGFLMLTSFLLFPPNVPKVTISKPVSFNLIRPQGMSPKAKPFVPEWICKLCCQRAGFTVDNDSLLPALLPAVAEPTSGSDW
ncbi:hypothetical protein CHARACLAT_012742 [Characodon lateralis]|uniref:Uncharacterized protein n=1 Tax=Characodon lateralis TaxID=208331 RepID=A0ABU7EIJ1_9TELE|nr:hypothetical protein [Characodon lateralis]